MKESYAKRFNNTFGGKAPVIGMIHLFPLPGSPNFDGNLDDVIERALADAEAHSMGGVDALLIENFHDYPFYPQTIEPETVASAAVCAREVARHTSLPIGINILRNSWKASLGIAAAVDAQFIRLNILTDAAITDQGFINSEAHLVARYKKAIDAEHVLTLGDLLTKHAEPLVQRSVPVIANDMLMRGGADALVLSGDNSSIPADPNRIQQIKDAIPDAPVIMGSGMTIEHAATYAKLADGAIFGYGSKPGADMVKPVSSEMAREFVQNWKSTK